MSVKLPMLFVRARTPAEHLTVQKLSPVITRVYLLTKHPSNLHLLISAPKALPVPVPRASFGIHNPDCVKKDRSVKSREI